MEWIKKNAHNIIIVATIIGSLAWLDAKFDRIDNRFSLIEKDIEIIRKDIAIIKEALIMQKILLCDLAEKGD